MAVIGMGGVAILGLSDITQSRLQQMLAKE